MIEGFYNIYILNTYGLGFVLVQFFFVVGLNLILDFPKKSKKGILIKIIDILLSSILMIIISSIYAGYSSDSYYDPFLTLVDAAPLIFSICLVLFNIFIKHKRASEQIVVALLFYTTFDIQSNLAGWVGTCQDYKWHLDTNFDFTFWINVIIMIIVILLILIFDFRKFVFIPKSIIFFVSIFLLFSLTNIFLFRKFLLKDSIQNFPELFIIIYLLFCVLSISVYLMIYYNAKSYNDRMIEQVMKDNSKSFMKMYEVSEEKYNSLRKINHDLKNHCAMISYLLKMQDYDKLEKYIDSYLENINEVIVFKRCGNKILDIILNIELAKCLNNNIELIYNISVPKEFKIDEVKLCALITNLIDNAIEALANSQDNRTITLNIYLHNQYFVVEVINYTTRKSLISGINELVTTKRDNYNHGWGLKIVNKICEEYNGFFDVKVENNNFIASALIEIKNGEKNE